MRGLKDCAAFEVDKTSINKHCESKLWCSQVLSETCKAINEQDFVVPGIAALPCGSGAEGRRNLTDAQETAQWLGGQDIPERVLQDLLPSNLVWVLSCYCGVMVAHVFWEINDCIFDIFDLFCFDSRHWSATYACGQLHLVWRLPGEVLCRHEFACGFARRQAARLPNRNQADEESSHGLVEEASGALPWPDSKIQSWDRSWQPAESSSTAWTQDLQLCGWGAGSAPRHQDWILDRHCQGTWVAQDHSRVWSMLW